MLTAEMLERARNLAIDLKAIREEEMDLRREIADALGGDIGMNTFSRDGFNIKLKNALSYNIDQEELQSLMDRDMLTEEETDLIRIKYDLKLADYKKAGDTSILDEAIIVKPAAPTLLITLGD